MKKKTKIEITLTPAQSKVLVSLGGDTPEKQIAIVKELVKRNLKTMAAAAKKVERLRELSANLNVPLVPHK